MNQFSRRKSKSSFDDLDELWEEEGKDPDALDPSFVDSLSSKELGEVGELIAISYLEERGYRVLEHSYRCPEGEADLVCFDESDDSVVMVEVKTRRAGKRDVNSFYPEEAVDARKQRTYRRIASCYLMDHYPIRSIRFDVVGITVVCGTQANIKHFHNAFDWDVDSR